MCCRSDFNSVPARLPCDLWKGPLKRDSLSIYLTTFFEKYKFKNTSAMSAIFFLKNLKIKSKFRRCKKKKKKN